MVKSCFWLVFCALLTGHRKFDIITESPPLPLLTCTNLVRALENFQKVLRVIVKLPPDQLALIGKACKHVNQ